MLTLPCSRQPPAIAASRPSPRPIIVKTHRPLLLSQGPAPQYKLLIATNFEYSLKQPLRNTGPRFPAAGTIIGDTWLGFTP